MIVVGLSGTVASGKSLAANSFSEIGVKIFDADKEVHDILTNDGEVFKQVKKCFPDSVINQKIDREILGKLVFNDKGNLEELEKIIHPVTTKRREKFIEKARLQKEVMVILNIPLLFEKNIHLECDKNILVKASRELQKERFLARVQKGKEGFDRDFFVKKFENIIQNQTSQMADDKKENLADFVIVNDKDENHLLTQVQEIYNQLIKS